MRSNNAEILVESSTKAKNLWMDRELEKINQIPPSIFFTKEIESEYLHKASVFRHKVVLNLVCIVC